jgi:hypothetical protein
MEKYLDNEEWTPPTDSTTPHAGRTRWAGIKKPDLKGEAWATKFALHVARGIKLGTDVWSADGEENEQEKSGWASLLTDEANWWWWEHTKAQTTVTKKLQAGIKTRRRWQRPALMTHWEGIGLGHQAKKNDRGWV